MANKALGTRQKLSFRIEPSQLAKPRAAGPHRKTASALRQSARLEVKKKLGEPEQD